MPAVKAVPNEYMLSIKQKIIIVKSKVIASALTAKPHAERNLPRKSLSCESEIQQNRNGDRLSTTSEL
jgi:hypothetical protein